jgi:hypothetical protein
MKILFAVHFVKMPNDCGRIFVGAWNNFLKYHKKDLECDVVFMSGGHTAEELSALAPDCDRCYQPEPFRTEQSRNSAQFGNALNHPTVMDAEDYDYIFRMDHDAFTTARSINELCSFLRSNPDVDFISPTNCPRNIVYRHPVIEEIYLEKKMINGREYHGFAPWGYCPNNGDLWGIRREFFKELCSKLGDPNDTRNWPYLLTHFKNYGDYCDILGFDDPRITEKVRETNCYVDGLFGGEAWTHFCALKPVAAGVVDRRTDKSFKWKNMIRVPVPEGTRYVDLVDEVDVSFPYLKNAAIDHILHMESGYTIPAYWKSMVNGKPNPSAGIPRAFRKDSPLAFPIVHFCLTKLLTKRFGGESLYHRLCHSIQKVYEYYGTDVAMIEHMEERVRKVFFEEAMMEYTQ